METKEKLLEMFEDSRLESGNKNLLKAKYGIESNKISEISKAILEKAMVLRKECECSEESVKIFNRYWDYPLSPSKIRKAFQSESDGFVSYYLESIREKVESNNRKYWVGDCRVQVLETILRERSKEKDSGLKETVNTLFKLTEDFHEHYVAEVLAYRMKMFSYFAGYKDLKVTVRSVYNSQKCRYEDKVVVCDNNTSKIPQSLSMKWLRVFNDVKLHSDNFNYITYESYCKTEAERGFRQNLELVAERVHNAGLDNETLKILYVEKDPKAFEMMLTDGVKKVHCRSVFCAEFSVLVAPHWRFIITNKK